MKMVCSKYGDSAVVESPEEFSALMDECGLGPVELRRVVERDGSVVYVDEDGDIVLVDE